MVATFTSPGYVAPESVDEVLNVLDTATDPQIIAGGQAIIKRLGPTGRSPTVLVDVTDIDELNQYSRDTSTITVGATVTLSELVQQREVPDVLQAGVCSVADREIRNQATVGGNLVQQYSNPDLLAPLTVLSAYGTVASPDGTRREISVRSLRDESKLGREELLTSVTFRLDTTGIYLTNPSEVSESTITGVAVSMSGRHSIPELKTAAVLPDGSLTPITAIEDLDPTVTELPEDFEQRIRQETKPRFSGTDGYSREYLSHLIATLGKRAVEKLAL